MATRHDKEARVQIRGNPELASKYLGEALKYLGQLGEAMGLGGLASGHRVLQNAQGVKFAVTKVMDDAPIIGIDVTEAKAEERAKGKPEHLYIGSDGGVRVFDLTEQKQLFSIEGLEFYEVDNVREDGGIIHLTGAGQAARVDLTTTPPTAYGGGTYPAIDLDEDGFPTISSRALVFEGKVSPDGTLDLLSFGQTRLPIGTVVTGVGGFQLAIAEVPLSAVRPTIRMSFRPYVSAWAPDSQHFFLSVSIPFDGDGVPPQDPNVMESTADYVAMFDRDGVLLSTRLVASWAGDPEDIYNAAYHRRIKSMVANNAGTRLYVLVDNDPSVIDGDPNTYVKVLDITTASMPIVTTLLLGTHRSDWAHRLSISRDDTLMYALVNNLYAFEDRRARMIGIKIEEDVLSIVSDTPDDFFMSSAMTSDAALDVSYFEVFRQGPAGDDRWFYFYKKEYTAPYPSVMYAYNDFAEEQVYSMDLASYDVLDRYVILFDAP